MPCFGQFVVKRAPQRVIMLRQCPRGIGLRLARFFAPQPLSAKTDRIFPRELADRRAPSQPIRFFFARTNELRTSSSECDRFIGPAPEEVVSDSHWRRGRQTVRVAAFNERNRLVAAEPARVLQLDAIDLEAPAFRFCKAADHQRRRERPWLRGKVLDRTTGDGGLLADFASDSSLDSLARLDETG